jgi:hypothetical protein
LEQVGTQKKKSDERVTWGIGKIGNTKKAKT